MDKWHLKSGKDFDIVFSSRIRIARNLTDFPFPNKMTDEQKFEVIQKISDCIFKSNLRSEYSFVDVNRLNEYELFALAHKHLISPEFAKNPKGRALILKHDESVSIMINEEDHIRIQSMCTGLELENSYKEALKIEQLLAERLNFAFDKKFGFLTECPSNLGTGIRASAMVHLPALEGMGALENIFNSASKMGLAIRGTFGEGTKAKSSMYQISNQVTLGVSEKEIIESVENTINRLVLNEKEARNSFEDDYVKDSSSRALGTLKYACLLSSDELYELLSKIRFGVSKNVLDIPVAVLNDINLNNSGAGICSLHNKELDAKQRDEFRAKNVKKLLENW